MKESKQLAISSELISELLTDMRLRGVQYRRIQTGPTLAWHLIQDQDTLTFTMWLWEQLY